jgi:hypothetical protein
MRLENKLKDTDWARVAFLATVAVAVFLTGGVFAKKRMQPYPAIEEGLKAAETIYQQEIQRRPDLLREIVYAGDGVLRYEADRAYHGLTLVQGLFPEGVELRLLDMSGDVIHRWRVSFFDIWPEPAHVPPEARPATHLNYHTQGTWLLADGALVFNVGNLGSVKMDKCGKVLWTVDRLTHHSVTADANGSFWIPARADPRRLSEDLMLEGITAETPAESLTRYEDRLLRVSADGVIDREFSVLRALFDGGFTAQLFDSWTIEAMDPTHINDIEVVTPPLAAKIEGVRAGDLLVSIRQMHMLAIFDQETGVIKWHQTGPWVRQHDPDITDDGIIEVYDNGGEHLNSDRFEGSRIIALDAATGETEVLYPRLVGERFYSRIMGTHQLLPNGNRLITESMAGRIFEVDANGEIVWEHVTQFDDTYAGLIESAIRYDEDYFSIKDWSCSQEVK